jgi:hypothetical protein
MLTIEDRLEIQELSARFFYALDGLTKLFRGDAAEHWVKTFTPEGRFSIVQAGGEVVVEARGRENLLNLFKGFPDIEITRHWINDLLIEPESGGARSGCYIIAINIQDNPSTIIRTGIYQDVLIKWDGMWKFSSRKLILDSNSPALVNKPSSGATQ